MNACSSTDYLEPHVVPRREHVVCLRACALSRFVPREINYDDRIITIGSHVFERTDERREKQPGRGKIVPASSQHTRVWQLIIFKSLNARNERGLMHSGRCKCA